MSKRDEIRSRVLESITGGLAQKPAERPRVRAYIADVGEQLSEGLAGRVERLEAERNAGLVVLRLDPKTIRPSGLANRLEQSLSEADPEFRQLKESIRARGQLEPIRVRPAPEDSGFQYEIVYGHRRHAACLALDAESEGGYRVLALLDAEAIDPQRLALLMHAENDVRENLSPFEYGQMYRSWLEAGLFGTQVELATAIGRSEATISQYLRVAELPAEVLDAFGDRRRIALRWVQNLGKALKADRSAVLAAARRLAEREPAAAPEEVFRELTAAPGGARRDSPSREETVKIQGRVACRIARKDGRITLKLGGMVDRQLQRELAEEIKDLVEARLTKRLKGKPT